MEMEGEREGCGGAFCGRVALSRWRRLPPVRRAAAVARSSPGFAASDVRARRSQSLACLQGIELLHTRPAWTRDYTAFNKTCLLPHGPRAHASTKQVPDDRHCHCINA